jgi:DNA-binding response OmpR family regulator
MHKKVYIADDETNIRGLLKIFLENAGYAVTPFESGDLLLSAFNENPADLVVLDIMMEGSSGYVICRELRKASNVPIIMLTARATTLDRETGFELGCDEYLVKPFSPTALVKRVGEMLERKAS